MLTLCYIAFCYKDIEQGIIDSLAIADIIGLFITCVTVSCVI